MKAAFCVLLLATAVFAVEEKKTEKRGVLGLGYGGYAAAPLLSHGYYGHGLGLYNHGVGLSGYGLGHGFGHGIYGGGLYGGGIYGHGLAGHSLVSHAAIAPPLLGLGHGWH